MKAISLDSAIIVTEISKRTLWRRLTDGQITRLDNDDRGRAMLAFDDLVPLLCVEVDPEEYGLFINADAGDPDAQNDLAQLFLDAGKPEIALYWLQSAVTAQQSVVSSQCGCNAQPFQALYQGNWRAEGRKHWPHVAGQGGSTWACHRQAADGSLDAKGGQD